MKKIYSCVVSIVKSDTHSSANDVLTIYNKVEFYKKYRYIFLQKAETFFTLASYILNLTPLWVTAYYT